jgi:Tfp pilus assembly protein PilO
MSRTGLLVGLLVALLVTAAWWFLLVGPQRTREADAADALQLARDEEVLLRTQLQSLRRIQDNELPYRAAIAELQASIPDTPQTASLIDDLAVLADETGVGWESATYGNPALNEDTELFEIPVAITINGQFFEVLGYLYGIADLDRVVRVDGLTISPDLDDDGFTILAVNLTGRAFSTETVLIPLAEDAGAGAGDDGDGATTTTVASDDDDDTGDAGEGATTTTNAGDDTTTTTGATDSSTTSTTTTDSSNAGDARAGGRL